MCESTAQCDGAPATVCARCTDGSWGCLHHACVDNRCTTKFCTPDLQCRTAADCKGTLPPEIGCMPCPDGYLAEWAERLQLAALLAKLLAEAAAER